MSLTPNVDPRAVLADPASLLAGTIRAVETLEGSEGILRQMSIGLSSNVTIDLLGVFVRKHALLSGVKANIRPGNHDDVLGDIETFARERTDLLVLLPFFDNLLPSFESQVSHLAPEAIAAKEEDVRLRYRLALGKATGIGTVFLGTFHRLSGHLGAVGDPIADVIDRFNAVLREEAAAFTNVKLIDMEDVVRTVGETSAFDHRFYFRAKAPYTTKTLDEIARRVAAGSRAFGTHFYKVLALDCDNTLWGGVIGEDLLGGIKLGPHDYPGNIYWRVQNELLGLEKAGVLLCLCSKNNAADVDEVLTSHPDMVLKDKNIILKKVNWTDKCRNLQDIARELNVGLDSIVFLDDSDFECSAVRQQLPAVRTFQVPTSLIDFPGVVSDIRELFLAGGVAGESRSKTTQYRQRAQAEEAQIGFGSNEEFLKSLQLKLEVRRDAVGSVARISELTIKSNQFNVTTRRYSVADIQQLMERPDSTVYSIVVNDKFGSAGLTGVIIVKWIAEVAVVDSFVMSCRVIGRGIEFAIWNEVLSDALTRSCTTFRAEYLPSAKNAQVADFFDRLGLLLLSGDDQHSRYEVPVGRFPRQHTPWIEVTSDK